MIAGSHPDVVTWLSSSVHAQYSVTSRLNQPSWFGTSLRPYHSCGGVVSANRNAASIQALLSPGGAPMTAT